MGHRIGLVVLVVLAATLGPLDARAGSSNADLTCTATGKKSLGLVLRGEIPGDHADFSLRLENADGRIDMNESENTIHVVDSFRDQVFTLAVGSKTGQNVHLYAVPRTIKTTDIPGGFKASFDAILKFAPNPSTKAESLHGVRMKCEYSYDV